MTLSNSRMRKAIRKNLNVGLRAKHVLTLIASDPGLRAFVFTFGP